MENGVVIWTSSLLTRKVDERTKLSEKRAKWLSNLNLKRKPREIDRKGRGAVVASVKRNSGRKKELQKAEYRNRKEGMATGRTEEEICTEGTAARGKREEGKRKTEG